MFGICLVIVICDLVLSPRYHGRVEITPSRGLLAVA